MPQSVDRPSTHVANRAAEDHKRAADDSAMIGADIEADGSQNSVTQMATKLAIAELTRANANLDKYNQIV